MGGAVMIVQLETVTSSTFGKNLILQLNFLIFQEPQGYKGYFVRQAINFLRKPHFNIL